MKNASFLALMLMPLGFSSSAFAQQALADGAANAGTASAWQVAFNAGAQSDYVFRGISQTNGHISGFAGADVTYQKHWYVGTWTSNVDFSPSGDSRTSQEYDLYGGWRPTLAGINVDLGYIYYGYRHQPQDIRQSYAEGYLRGAHAFGQLTLGGMAAYSPKFPGIAKDALYVEANIAYAISSALSATAAWGHQYESDATQLANRSRQDFNYTTWNAGISYAINAHTLLDLRYWDTNQHAAGDIYQSRAVVAIKATF